MSGIEVHPIDENVPPRSNSRIMAAVALIATALIPLTYIDLGGFPPGILFGAVLLPLWLGHLFRGRAEFVLACAFVVMGLFGYFISEFSVDLSYDPAVAISLYALLIRAFVSVGVFAWAIAVAGFTPVALSFAIGLFVNAVAADADSGNAWKYLFSAPVTIGVLAACAVVRRRWVSYIAILVLVVVSAVASYRSLIAILIVAVVMSLIMRRSANSDQGLIRSLTPLAALVAVFALASYALPRMLLAGFFGQQARLVSEAQIANGGELITGGRVETYGSIALFFSRPGGFGPGAIPTTEIATTVKGALYNEGVVASLQYVDNYMLGGRVKLHSVVADLWVNFGVSVFLFLAVCVVVIVRFLVSRAAGSEAPLIVWVLLIWLLWDLAFSPMYSNLTNVLFALVALAAFSRSGRQRRHVYTQGDRVVADEHFSAPISAKQAPEL